MKYVVAYDIGADAVRTRLARLLEGFGVRVQESVFECRLDENELERLTAAVTRELEACEDGEVRVYRVCADCLAASFGIGRSVRRAGPGPLVV